MYKNTIAVLLIFWFGTLVAKDIRIITPYFGTINNQLAIENMNDLDDSAPMGGLYFQWVNPEKYQWNIFIYGSKNINESNIYGSHFIYDYLLGKSDKGKYVVGLGLDYIRINTDGEISSFLSESDTDGGISTFLLDIKMTNNIYAPYIRGGHYFDFGNSTINASILLWTGYEKEIVRGDISIIMPSMAPGMPPTPVAENIKGDYNYALIGSNFKVTLYHFIELSAKYYYKIILDDGINLNTVSAMCNVYLSRSIGLSYRFKYMEVSVSQNTYHMGGVAYLF